MVGSGQRTASSMNLERSPFFSPFCARWLRSVDLSRLPLTRDGAWASGARLSLAVTNAFDTRQSVHDATGMTPTAFAPGYLDPAGRVVSITLRKLF
jgi:outer membrane receptor protein involved in Fe transport